MRVEMFALVFLAWVSFGCSQMFKMYSRSNEYGKNCLKNKLTCVRQSGFDGRKHTYFLVHGYAGGAKSYWLYTAGNALLTKGDYNVVLVEWGKYAFDPVYLSAVRKTKTIVGPAIANFIKWLETAAGASRTRMTLVGHSLGGQVVAFAGAALQNPKVARVIGLDTIEKGFNLRSPNDCLDPSDGTFVQEIHTTESKTSKGHADFFPIGAGTIPNDHMRVVFYFIQSISRCPYRAYRCTNEASPGLQPCSRTCNANNCNNMGFAARHPGGTGVRYYLVVSAYNPFC